MSLIVTKIPAPSGLDDWPRQALSFDAESAAICRRARAGRKQPDETTPETNLDQKLPQPPNAGHVMGRRITRKSKKSPIGNQLDYFAGTKSRFHRYIWRLSYLSQVRNYIGPNWSNLVAFWFRKSDQLDR
ncbi:MAG: hypothetical protein ABUL43_01320 [Hyphomicrobium sp.]